MKQSPEVTELLKCAVSPLYFIQNYCWIYDADVRDWIPFTLWKQQIDALHLLHNNQLTIALKARQLGMTWLGLSYALWQMLFNPIATILLFSRRDDEAIYLLSEERLRGMYARLPKWMQAKAVVVDSAHSWGLSNGSTARSFPTTSGDGYTATMVLCDEADLVPDLNRMMRSVKPTIDAGGKLFMISRVDKSKPLSEFKRIYKSAKAGTNGWACIFLPWHIRPERDAAWYDRQRRDILERTGSLDDLHEQYPATDAEALAPRSLDKRIPAQWVNACYDEQRPMAAESVLAINGLSVYSLPEPGRKYRIGADPAEGNPTSDDSAATVLDYDTGEEVAMLVGKFEPSTFAAHLDAVSRWYNSAPLLVERNNHGHAVLLWLRDNGKTQLLRGHDRKEGWLSNSKGKALMYDTAADAFRERATLLHSPRTHEQLTSIEGATLRAPKDQPDDLADSYALALCALAMRAAVPDTIEILEF